MQADVPNNGVLTSATMSKDLLLSTTSDHASAMNGPSTSPDANSGSVAGQTKRFHGNPFLSANGSRRPVDGGAPVTGGPRTWRRTNNEPALVLSRSQFNSINQLRTKLSNQARRLRRTIEELTELTNSLITQLSEREGSCMKLGSDINGNAALVYEVPGEPPIPVDPNDLMLLTNESKHMELHRHCRSVFIGIRALELCIPSFPDLRIHQHALACEREKIRIFMSRANETELLTGEDKIIENISFTSLWALEVGRLCETIRVSMAQYAADDHVTAPDRPTEDRRRHRRRRARSRRRRGADDANGPGSSSTSSAEEDDENTSRGRRPRRARGRRPRRARDRRDGGGGPGETPSSSLSRRRCSTAGP